MRVWFTSKGSTGAKGDTGNSSYTYIAYASDASGTGFTTTFNAALDYIAVKSTTAPIASPQASDFTGLWKNYKGATGAAGAAATQTLEWSGEIAGTVENGSHFIVTKLPWNCTIDKLNAVCSAGTASVNVGDFNFSTSIATAAFATPLSVSTTRDEKTPSGDALTATAGYGVTLEITNASGCSNLSFTIEYTIVPAS